MNPLAETAYTCVATRLGRSRFNFTVGAIGRPVQLGKCHQLNGCEGEPPLTHILHRVLYPSPVAKITTSFKQKVNQT